MQDGGVHRKVPQIGNVVIGDDVEIGANVTIDRGALGSTVIGKGTKIDNLVQIAHNVEIGEHCIIIAQVGISGSTKLGKYVILAGQVGLAGHLKIGNHVTVAAQVRRDARHSRRREMAGHSRATGPEHQTPVDRHPAPARTPSPRGGVGKETWRE